MLALRLSVLAWPVVAGEGCERFAEEVEGLVKRWVGAEDEGVRRLAYGLAGKWKVGGWVGGFVIEG